MNARSNSLPWTQAQDEQLRALARANTPTAVIADRMGRRPEAVFQRAYELGLLNRETKRPTAH